ncbi:hypothetical protein [Aminobacter sp. AP02]|uniref:hypothetical protein n=1 Tax=Aminobacter sp. AP02 TaxID=2135737 RepID=UPI001FDED0BA|nr:hypothetical protein [Aminobacter sp. AP02]
MSIQKIVPALLGLLAAIVPAHAEGDAYTAFSTTAESITGDISMAIFPSHSPMARR